MLWFYMEFTGQIKGISKFQYISCYGSMAKGRTINNKWLVFQYISCYGSIICIIKICLYIPYFNTSHVMVLYGRLPKMQNRILISIHLMLWFYAGYSVKSIILQEISIHLMLWFYGVEFEHYRVVELFQYISCYGSIFIHDMRILIHYNFNTSHVMVLLMP